MSNRETNWKELLHEINVRSVDDGERFTCTERLEQIENTLQKTSWTTVHKGSLCVLYQQKGFVPEQPWLLISTHIDALYTRCFHEERGQEWVGTFDNSLTNTLALEAMLHDKLPSNAMVVFTGDEEGEGGGASEVMEYLRYRHRLWKNLQLVITLDLTAEGFSRWSFAIENYFCPDSKERLLAPMQFETDGEFRAMLHTLLEEQYYSGDSDYGEFGFVHADEAGPDESWEYDEYDQLCFSLCLPCAPLPSLRHEPIEVWMHHDHGCRVRTEDIERFRDVLVDLSRGLVRRCEG